MAHDLAQETGRENSKFVRGQRFKCISGLEVGLWNFYDDLGCLRQGMALVTRERRRMYEGIWQLGAHQPADFTVFWLEPWLLPPDLGRLDTALATHAGTATSPVV